jgi:hypothetical protein
MTAAECLFRSVSPQYYPWTSDREQIVTLDETNQDERQTR